MHMSRCRVLVRLTAAAATITGLALLPVTASAAAPASPAYVSDPASLVNPFIGTANGGDTFPGADEPFGMIQWSPDTPDRPSGGGYDYDASSIIGYSLDHLSGPGCAAEDDVPILPTAGAIGTDPSDATAPLDHTQETASPGYYQLTAGGVNTQLATALRSGIGSFTFPTSSTSGNLLFQLSQSANPDAATHFQVVSDTEISGWVTTGDFCGASNQYTLHFDVVFNRPFTAYGTWTNGSGPDAGSASLTTRLSAAQQAQARQQAKLAGLTALSSEDLPGSSASRAGRQRAADRTAAVTAQPPVTGADGAYLTFATGANPVVEAKVGLSYVSNQNATLNRLVEIPGWNLAAVESDANQAWNQALSKIQIAGGTPTQQTLFYTALYHSLLHPNIASDVNGQYSGFDGQIHSVTAGHAEYANYSGWDIYRSQSQLEAMLFPQTMSDTVNSMLDDYNQTGMLPKWSEDNGESYVMVGDPSDAIIADAYAFGARGFDAGQALSDMETEASVANNIRPGLNYYLNDGYLPIDGTYGCCNYYGPVSTQEEYDAADSSISELARSLGDSTVATTYATRANNWQNVFNPGSDFLQPKLMDGSFQSGFDPTSGNGFVEADAYVYTAELPFDLAGLVRADGGDANWVKYLNGLTSSVTGMGSTQIQMGNEPSFDIPWEYDYAGDPSMTQQVVREIQDQLYLDTPGGLAGNDDLGAMSSWYVWSALGAYPETPGSADVALGSPLFTNIAIHLGNGRTITESAPEAADDAPYVDSVTLNAIPWNRSYLPAGVFRTGGTVNWTLGSTPSTTWASDPIDAPPSDTSGLLPALGYVSDAQGTGNALVVTPGTNTTMTLGVQGMTDSSQTIGWTASPSAGSGLQLATSSGSLIVGPEGTTSQQIQVSVPPGTADGDYQVTFDLSSATGTTLPPVVEDIAVASAGDLTPFFNDAGISSDTDQGTANFDGDGFSYSEQALAAAGLTAGSTVTSSDGIQYNWPSAAPGEPDNVTAGGQTIQLLQVPGETELGLLGSATNGPSTGQLTITYTDGSTQTASLVFGDWTLNAGSSGLSSGNVQVAQMSYRNSTGGSSQSVGTYVFSAAIPLTAGKTVASITLPATTDQGSLHVFAVGSDKGPLTTG